jgi:hypothetical protein
MSQRLESLLNRFKTTRSTKTSVPRSFRQIDELVDELTTDEIAIVEDS